MIANASEKSEILKALRKQVAALEADLTPTGLADSRLKIEWRAARSAERTAATFVDGCGLPRNGAATSSTAATMMMTL